MLRCPWDWLAGFVLGELCKPWTRGIWGLSPSSLQNYRDQLHDLCKACQQLWKEGTKRWQLLKQTLPLFAVCLVSPWRGGWDQLPWFLQRSGQLKCSFSSDDNTAQKMKRRLGLVDPRFHSQPHLVPWPQPSHTFCIRFFKSRRYKYHHTKMSQDDEKDKGKKCWE